MAKKSEPNKDNLYSIVCGDDIEKAYEAAQMMTDQKQLYDAYQKVKNETICNALISNINNPKVLKNIVKKSRKAYERHAALRNITDQKFLMKIALKDKDQLMRKIAIDRITSIPMLLVISDESKYWATQYYAQKKLYIR